MPRRQIARDLTNSNSQNQGSRNLSSHLGGGPGSQSNTSKGRLSVRPGGINAHGHRISNGSTPLGTGYEPNSGGYDSKKYMGQGYNDRDTINSNS